MIPTKASRINGCLSHTKCQRCDRFAELRNYLFLHKHIPLSIYIIIFYIFVIINLFTD